MILLTKAFKSNQLKNSSTQEIYVSKKILPLPIVRRSVPNSKRLRSRLIIEGHKHFNKFVASGEETDKTLIKLQRSGLLKSIYSFEFDPYLSDISCIKAVINTFKRLKETKKINLIIRRVDYTNETDCLNPFLYKIPRMEKLKLSFPQTLNINEEGLMQIARVIGKCYRITSLEYEFIG